MPLYSLVKLARTRAMPLEGLQNNVIPIEPAITARFSRQGVCKNQEKYMRSFLDVKWVWDSESVFRFLIG